jgi:ABC-type transport system involved in cytochrome c biogenesis ATPase subunit
VPYWLGGAGVRNDVELLSGRSVVLTGANGGGKSTLLRGVASVALLAQCGLLVPCAAASVPRFTHIFLRMPGHDCAVQRQGSFAAEMHDMAGMLRAAASEPALLLLDEPCRGTSTAQGVALLESILAHTPPLATAVVTTHFYELQAPGSEWMQLTSVLPTGAEEDGGDCLPSYRLAFGKCNDSMALPIALAAGLPEGIVGEARLDGDVHTLLRLSMRKLGLGWLHILRGQVLPAATRSIVYVIPTDGGVYIGESDRGDQRIAQHGLTKNFDSFYAVPMADKTRARAVETMLERELLSHNVTLLSVCDAHHAIE